MAAAQSNWFKSLSPAAQKAYVKAHPGSKYAKQAKAKEKATRLAKPMDKMHEKISRVAHRVAPVGKAPSASMLAKLTR